MAKIALFTEFSDSGPKSVTLEILGKLSDHEVNVFGVGDLSSAADELKKYGATCITSLKASSLDRYSPDGYAQLIASFLKTDPFDYLFAGSTPLAKDLFPRLSGMLDVGMASEVTEMAMEGDALKASRPLFAGKILADVEVVGPKPHIYTVRPNALGMPSSPTSKDAEIKAVDEAHIDPPRAMVKELIKGLSEKVDLAEANIIVSGGRALKSSENFKILDDLANVLGATVGASRAAVDSGYAPHSMQVGQTGKTVSPTLYIACGISGSIQHLAGMRTSKVIVAVNTDPDAPIFQKTDYGIVGDLFEIVPLLTEELKKILN
ncbi:MAG: electron transfer flavoprotein subunit alpha/FixB family protein [Bacteriovoracales bacterium]|nr:electron transfer flavoprotein subunit alpha/FixB family protein [Bacteriovoracales bacterium]